MHPRIHGDGDTHPMPRHAWTPGYTAHFHLRRHTLLLPKDVATSQTVHRRLLPMPTLETHKREALGTIEPHRHAGAVPLPWNRLCDRIADLPRLRCVADGH